MSLFGFFSNKCSPEAVAKQVRKVKERYAQSDYRKMAMEKLLKWNTKESLFGVLQRFTVVVQSPHWDEDEKRWLVEELVKCKEIAKEPLIDFIMKENAVTHAMEALSKMVSEDELIDILIEALKKRAVDDYRTEQAKKELIAKLAEYKLDKVIAALAPYVDDHNDDVQCLVIDAFCEFGSHEVDDRLAQMITENFQSARVLRHAATAVATLGIPLLPDKPLADDVAEEFAVSAGKLVRAEDEAS